MNISSTNSIGIPTLPILEMVEELTIGQRTTDTTEKLSAFLHGTIFQKLGPFAVEIYYYNHSTGDFAASQRVDSHNIRQKAKGIPQALESNNPVIKKLTAKRQPIQISNREGGGEDHHFTITGSHLYVPIMDSRDLCGVLYIGSSNHNTPFSDEFCSAIKTLAAIIGSRLKSMHTIQQLKQSMEDLEYSERIRTALNEISEQAHDSVNINSLYAKLHQIVSGLIHAPNFYICVVQKKDDGNYLTFPYYADDQDPHLQGLELQINNRQNSLTGYLLKSRKPLLLTPENLESICRNNSITIHGSRPHSWLGAPFYLDNIQGAVAVQSYSNTVYTEQDKQLMAFVARHIGVALTRKRAVDDLKEAKERAELAEKNKSAFLANMSHEIRTPMNGIIGLTELVLQTEISAQQRSYLEMVSSSANRLLKLINDILDFSKIDAGKLELSPGPFSLRNLLAGAMEILSISARKKNLDLIIHCEDALPDRLLGDGDKLSQIFINLVGNGIKFTNSGSVSITVTRSVKNAPTTDQVELHFQVRDTGIGIPEDKQASVFEAFNQLGTTRDSSQRGTGLGLVIAAELVELMGGNISVESEEGLGTCFHFILQFPVVQPSGDGARKTEHPIERRKALLPQSPLKILLAEDEYINKTLAVTLLEKEGWQVSTAEDGREVIEKFSNDSFDLILMDIQMPEIDGFVATRIIREKEQKLQSHIPIIAMTAYAVKGDREKCLEAGMDGYISKPIRPEKLCDEITKVLNQLWKEP
jgi:signal transduction histidine kinase/CheY-like chemotaxis protein